MGVVALVTGAVLLPLGNADAQSINTSTGIFDPSLESGAHAKQGAGVAMIAVGVAGVAAGVTVLVLGVRERRAPVAMAPWAAPGGGGLVVAGRF